MSPITQIDSGLSALHEMTKSWSWLSLDKLNKKTNLGMYSVKRHNKNIMLRIDKYVNLSMWNWIKILYFVLTTEL